jgi:cysteinyl-tRNA synthetase
MYVCGIAPYATTHLGHAFTCAAANVLIRYLEDQGYRVRYVQNLPLSQDNFVGSCREDLREFEEDDAVSVLDKRQTNMRRSGRALPKSPNPQ